METQQNRYNELAEKWLNGTITSAEVQEYNQWYNIQPGEVIGEEDSEAISSETTLKNRIWKNIQTQTKNKHFRIHRLRKFQWGSVAASLLIIMGVSLYFNYHRHETICPPALVKDVASKNDVLPGVNKAVLTLADGRTITLDSSSKGLLAMQGLSKIVKGADGQIIYKSIGKEITGKELENKMSTPMGAQYQLKLPDGTEVWLNAGSSITYPTCFSGKTRQVHITGEVYFEVTKNREKPFIVTTGDMSITVLGTHFNVNAYADESTIRTTLLEGRVKVSNALNGQNIFIKPGQQSQLSKSGNIKVVKVNVDEAVAWKNGSFQFDKTDISELMRQVSRWYNISIKYDGPMTPDCFTGVIPRNLTLNELLAILKDVKVHFKLENNILNVMS
ncbi:FecR family protein [Arachidicoccus sp.]|uniref:FecR family protein n=1 Tax=Arachidicoccus sp. TaxID=1872624 RepID=UPI003D1D6C6F